MKYYLIKEKDVQEGKYIPHQLIQREITRVELTEEELTLLRLMSIDPIYLNRPYKGKDIITTLLNIDKKIRKVLE